MDTEDTDMDSVVTLDQSECDVSEVEPLPASQADYRAYLHFVVMVMWGALLFQMCRHSSSCNTEDVQAWLAHGQERANHAWQALKTSAQTAYAYAPSRNYTTFDAVITAMMIMQTVTMFMLYRIMNRQVSPISSLQRRRFRRASKFT